MPGSGLRWGIAGYGDIVRRRALPALLSQSAQVTRIWGRNPARAQSLCDEFGAGRAAPDYADLLSAVDVVYVATPVAAHVPLTVEAVRAGLPVLVEKPLGLFATQGHALDLDACAAGGPTVGVAYYRRLAPALARLRDLLAGRAVRHATVALRSGFDPAPDDPRGWRTDPAVAGGGVLADIGSHRLDLLVWLLGEPSGVRATLGDRFPAGAERAARMSLSWQSGARAEVEVAWATGHAYDRLTVEFDGGRLTLDPLDSGWIRGTVEGLPIEERLPPAANPHAPLMADFALSVRRGTAPICPVGDAAIVDRLLATAYQEKP
jgi:predicted dehydrogenase